MVELRSHGGTDKEANAAAVEEGHAGHFEQKRQAERVAVEADGSRQVPRIDGDLADVRFCEIGGVCHAAESNAARRETVPPLRAGLYASAVSGPGRRASEARSVGTFLGSVCRRPGVRCPLRRARDLGGAAGLDSGADGTGASTMSTSGGSAARALGEAAPAARSVTRATRVNLPMPLGRSLTPSAVRSSGRGP